MISEGALFENCMPCSDIADEFGRVIIQLIGLAKE